MRYTLIQFSTYFLFMLSNIVLILAIPQEISQAFLRTFSASSFLFSLFVFVVFSSTLANNAITISKISVLIISVGLILIYFPGMLGLVLGYTLLLYYADYLTSVISNRAVRNIFRILVAAPVVLILANVDFFDILLIRILVCAIIAGILVFYLQKRVWLTVQLRVKKPIHYSISTHVTHFGGLYIISILGSDENIKYMYISYQLVSMLWLRYMDLFLRREIGYAHWILIFAMISAVVVPILAYNYIGINFAFVLFLLIILNCLIFRLFLYRNLN